MRNRGQIHNEMMAGRRREMDVRERQGKAKMRWEMRRILRKGADVSKRYGK